MSIAINLLFVCLGFISFTALCGVLYHINVWRRPYVGGALALALCVSALTALGAELGSVRGRGLGGGDWSFTLYDEAGVCRGHYKRTVYRQSGPAMEVEGCWIESADKVHLYFVDGDRYVIPRSAFRDAGA